MPRSETPASSAANASETRLRDKIDAGQTDDKVAASDPAMAPLGTDNEAADGHDEEGLAVARRAPKPDRK
jgi:hypothetical protein